MFSNTISKWSRKQQEIIDLIRQKTQRLQSANDLDPLMQRIGDARIVMLGEASHGTHEYYTWRSHITQRLIQEKGFNFIAVEGDWPDCYSLNRYIKQYVPGKTAREVLNEFERWPSWMWANREVAALAEWLHSYNSPLPKNEKVGFYGLDVYSLWDSMDEIKRYLERVDPATLKVANEAFECFEPYKKDDGHSYAYASQMVPELCETEVVDLLKQIQQKMPTYDSDFEMAFSTEQNALVAVNAEKYYRAMVRGGGQSWNVRDGHMEETLERLLNFHGRNSKVVVWAHNTHIGDSRYTDMVDDGMYNIGELVREKYAKEDVVLVGFGSYEGSVIAGKSWGAPMKKMNVPKAKEGTWEHLLHEAGADDKLLIMDDLQDHTLLNDRIGHRAIGVVYNPEYERYGNYVPSILPRRYDAFLYIDKTKALHPLHMENEHHDMPDTFPFGV
jgi:erythromycin esterase-like protein